MQRHARLPWLLTVAALLAGLTACTEAVSVAAQHPSRDDAPPTFRARIQHVADGDTVTVRMDGERVRIRLWGIDAPESDQPRGDEATERAVEALHGKTVTFVWHDTDRFGRRVCEIILPGGENFNETLVREGLAWWYQYFAPDAAHLREAQREAMEAQRGLWRDPGAMAPWDWRRRDRAAPALPERDDPGRPEATADESALGEEPDDDPIVYITESGARYHREDCRHLTTRRPLPLSTAADLGYTPCRVCRPPAPPGSPAPLG